MAQESRITSFEKALKDEGIAGTNLEPVARSIFQQESSSGANVKTSNAGARGPMQVLPTTFKAYNPQGNIDDPYDNSVGGLRYIKDLFSKTNDLGLTAVGYYGGPKAIEKAKQGVAVSDPRNPNAPNTLQYMEQVMGRTKGSQAQPTPRGNKPPVNPLIKQKITDLGPSYQAALALMAKADDLSEAREKIAEEEELASAGADFSQAKQMLAQIKPTSPFPAQEPRRMAEGGLMSATIAPKPFLSSKDKAKQADYEKQIKDYEAKRTAYNASVDAYNEKIKRGIQQEDYYNLYPDVREAGVNAFEHYMNHGYREGRQLPGFDAAYYLKANPDVAADPVFGSNPFLHFYRHGAGEGRLPISAPTQLAPPSVTQAEINAFSKQAVEKAQQNALLRGRAMRAVQAPRQFNIGSFGLGDVSGFAGTSTPLFADGGEVEKKPEPSTGEKVKGTAKEILRSMQYTPYDLLGAPVDVINLGLKGVDYVTGSKLATEKPVGGSDYLIQKSRELGIADKPTGSTTETLTRLGTGIISPTAGPRAVVAAGKAVKGTAKAALEDLAMASTGQGGSKVAQQIMAPGTAFAVRPKGGVYLGARSVDEPVLTDFDLRIKEIVDNLDKSDPQQKEVASFFDKKVRNYIMNQQGTVDDPIFKKMMTGEIPNFTYASQEVVDAARAGDKAALAEVRNAYDASLSINALVGRKQLKESGKTQHQLEKALKKKIQEQSPDDYITALMASVYKFEPEDIKKYPALYGSPGFKQFAEESESGALLRMMNKSDLPPHIRRAIAEGEPIFASNRGGIGGDRAVDAQELQDYLLTRNPNDIKNMGFADAVVQSKQWHARLEAARRDPSKFSPKQLYEGTKDVLPVADSMKWVDLRTPDALSLEGNIMGHCVGGSGYCSGVAKDTTKILSLRDKKGIPHVTIELRKGMDNKFNTINQIKGVGNKPAEKYFPQIEEFLNDYSAKLGDNLYITEGKSYLPPNWRNK